MRNATTQRHGLLWLTLLISMVLVIVPFGSVFASGTEESAVDQQEELVELDLWTFWGSETRRPIIEHIVDLYNDSQEENLVSHTFLPWGDIWTKNLASIAAGNPANVIVNDINAVAQRAEQNQVTDITDLVEAESEDISARYFPELWNTVVHDDKVWAIPFTTDTRFMFYNKAHFEEAGLDPENPPSTWAELRDAAMALDAKSGNRYTRIGYYPLWGNFGYDTWLLNADNGRGYFNYETGEVLVDTPRKAAAINWINEWTARLGRTTVQAFQAEFGSQQADPFLSEKVSIIITTGTFFTQIRDYGQHIDLGVAPVPEFQNGTGHWTSGGGFVVEIPQGAANVEQSYDFLKFLGGTEAQAYWAAMNFDNVAHIEGSKAAAESTNLTPQGRDVYLFAVENMEWTKISPVPVDAPEFWSLKNPQIDAALLGQISAEEALERAQADIEALIERNR